MKITKTVFLVTFCIYICISNFISAIRLNCEIKTLQGNISNISHSGNVTMASPEFPSNRTSKFFIYEFISPVFYTNLNGSVGTDYIALKSEEGLFLGCDINGNLDLKSKNITEDNLFVPLVYISDKKFGLRSWHGGYLGWNETSWNCVKRKMDNSTEFKIEKNLDLKSLNLNVSDLNETLTLKFNKGYLGSVNNQPVLVEKLNKSALWLSQFKLNLIENLSGPFYYEMLDLD